MCSESEREREREKEREREVNCGWWRSDLRPDLLVCLKAISFRVKDVDAFP